MGKESLFDSLLRWAGWKAGEKPKSELEKAPGQAGNSMRKAPHKNRGLGGHNLYERWAGEGREWGRDRQGEWQKPEPRFMAFLDKYKEGVGPNVLDIGCGNARHLLPLAEKGYNVTGVDSSPQMLATARERIEEADKTCTLVESSHNKLPIEDESQDTVVSSQTFQFSGSEKSFFEAARVLKPGGLFFLRVRSTSRYSDEYIESRSHIQKLSTNKKGGQEVEVDYPQGKVRYHHYSLEELQDMADLANLEIIEEPVDERSVHENGHVEPGQWNIVFRKKEK